MLRIGPVALRGGGLIRFLDLAENLPLAQDKTFETRRDPKQMRNRFLVVTIDQMRQELVGAQGVKSRQKFGERADFGSIRPRIAGSVKLDAVACRNHDELGVGKRAFQGVETFGAFSIVESERLANGGRRGAMIDPQGQELHGEFLPPDPSRRRSVRPRRLHASSATINSLPPC